MRKLPWVTHDEAGIAWVHPAVLRYYLHCDKWTVYDLMVDAPVVPWFAVKEEALEDFLDRYREDRLLDNVPVVVLRLRQLEDQEWREAGF
jgi:hypothetical protein